MLKRIITSPPHLNWTAEWREHVALLSHDGGITVRLLCVIFLCKSAFYGLVWLTRNIVKLIKLKSERLKMKNKSNLLIETISKILKEQWIIIVTVTIWRGGRQLVHAGREEECKSAILQIDYPFVYGLSNIPANVGFAEAFGQTRTLKYVFYMKCYHKTQITTDPAPLAPPVFVKIINCTYCW